MEISPSSPIALPPRSPLNGGRGEQAANTGSAATQPQTGVQASAQDTSPEIRPRNNNRTELTDEQRTQVAKLQSRDREVRAHEAAHLAAAGGLARGGASFSYTTGPDNRRYAVGGEVSIDTSPADSPEKTIQKAQTIQAAALAPAKPSSQDSAVAASAAKMAAQARAELSANRAQESQDATAARQTEAADRYSSTAGVGVGNENTADNKRIDVMV